jgi:hypothetical protein
VRPFFAATLALGIAALASNARALDVDPDPEVPPFDDPRRLIARPSFVAGLSAAFAQGFGRAGASESGYRSLATQGGSFGLWLGGRPVTGLELSVVGRQLQHGPELAELLAGVDLWTESGVALGPYAAADAYLLFWRDVATGDAGPPAVAFSAQLGVRALIDFASARHGALSTP